MLSPLARLFFLLRIALEKSFLALWGKHRRFAPSPSQNVLRPVPAPQEVFPLGRSEHCPYISPWVAPEDWNKFAALHESEAEIVYFDHLLRGRPQLTFLKPAWSPELWLSVDLLFGAAYNTAYLKHLARQSSEKLMARAILQAKRIVRFPNLLIEAPFFPWQSPEHLERHRQTVHDYLTLLGVSPPAIEIRPNGSLRFRWKPSDAKVSIVIPNRNNLKLLTKCIASIYTLTDYPAYEIVVVDDHSTDPALLRYYRTLMHERDNFRVLEGEIPFNFSRACNQGAKQARGDFVLFLNNDTEVLYSDWLSNLVGVASLPGVGAVGAKLIYPNGRVQHAGVVIGLEGHAAHVFQGVSDDPFTPYGHVDWMRNVSAVTAACMLVRKDAFWEIGGFDERFQLAFGDIDFCLRLRDAGYRIVYTPDACLIHHEGKSRGKHIPPQDIRAKAEYFLQKVAEGDPYYHPHLSRAWRIPTFRWRWEQHPAQRLKEIIRHYG
ncbi:MAG: glycosyltransferase family 2 protein [Anaerolineales bacterium]|nr:glycosyltransferase family 2 protein [Anaerolineales bacterium]MDW8162923.1 glycosyltransferase family 2 protein [Anaerolineales bacterium]